MGPGRRIYINDDNQAAGSGDNSVYNNTFVDLSEGSFATWRSDGSRPGSGSALAALFGLVLVVGRRRQSQAASVRALRVRRAVRQGWRVPCWLPTWTHT